MISKSDYRIKGLTVLYSRITHRSRPLTLVSDLRITFSSTYSAQIIAHIFLHVKIFSFFSFFFFFLGGGGVRGGGVICYKTGHLSCPILPPTSHRTAAAACLKAPRYSFLCWWYDKAHACKLYHARWIVNTARTSTHVGDNWVKVTVSPGKWPALRGKQVSARAVSGLLPRPIPPTAAAVACCVSNTAAGCVWVGGGEGDDAYACNSRTVAKRLHALD